MKELQNIVIAIVKDRDFEIPADWRSGFSGVPCGISTTFGNQNLVTRWVRKNLPVSEQIAVEFHGDVRQMVLEAKQMLGIQSNHRWSYEIPILQAVYTIRRLNLSDLSTREVATIVGLSVPRTEFALSIA